MHSNWQIRAARAIASISPYSRPCLATVALKDSNRRKSKNTDKKTERAETMRHFQSAAHLRIAGAAERRGVMFPLLMAGLLAVWTLGWTVMATQPTDHAEVDLAPVMEKTLVTCEPAGTPQPGVLLRCVVAPVIDRQVGI